MSWDILPKSNLQYFLTKLKGIFDNKVDKETGKGLFSGNYNDLTNKPSIPAAQVNSDWNASSGVAQILNKPTIPSTSDCMKKGVDYVTAGQASGTTLGYKATAEGRDVTASGNYSHAGGFNTSSSGDYSYADGASCYAEGTCARSAGANCLASGDYSYAQGEGSYAVSDHQHVQGKWNVPDENGIYAHIIGCGTNNVNRKNIFTVDWNGVARDGTTNRLLPFKAVSEAEYAALSQAEKTNGTAYFRYEANGIMREIQDNGSATSLTSGALPTGQTIESYLNSNIVNIPFSDFSWDTNTACFKTNAAVSINKSKIIGIFVRPTNGTAIMSAYINSSNYVYVMGWIPKESVNITNAYQFVCKILLSP